MTLTIVNKALIAAVVASFIAGVIIGRVDSKSQPASIVKSIDNVHETTAVAITEKAKDVDHKDVVTTSVKKIDGTVTVTTVDHSIITDKIAEKVTEDTSRDEKKTSETEALAPAGAAWSLGLSYSPLTALRGSPYAPSNFTPEIGWRVAGPLWITAAYHFDSHTPTVGIRIEF